MTSSPADQGRPRRLGGVDAARGIALFGMMSVHILPAKADDGSVSTAFVVAGGRASALFAVLAGVGLALGSGGTRPLGGGALAGARRALVARAAVIAAIGLSLGTVDAPVAVILAYYGVLFLAALPVLGWSAPQLAALAGGCALVTPILSVWLRARSDRGPGENVDWSGLAAPGDLLGSILLFGYYPVLTWTAYLYAGMAVGRCALDRTSTAARVAAGGGALALAGLGVDLLARRAAGGSDELAERLGTTRDALETTLLTSMYGTTPTQSWWWLLLAGRHSGSGPDLLHTGGTALAVLGGCLLVLPRLGRWWPVAAPLVVAGAMPLTLYTLHALTLLAGSGGGPGEVAAPVVLVVHVVVAVWLAALVGAPGRRGPLEELAARAARAARGPVNRSRPAPRAADGDGPPSAGTPPA